MRLGLGTNLAPRPALLLINADIYDTRPTETEILATTSTALHSRSIHPGQQAIMSSETPPLDAEPERPDPVRSARRVPRSCELCNRRKVRCDKKEPCSPCARAGKSCVFPPTARAARRPKRTIMADMAGRIASLEKSLAQATDGSESYRSTPRAPMSDGAGSSPLDSAEPATPAAMVERRRPGQDILLQKGSSSQYFNEVLLSRVIEEVCCR